MSDPFNGEIVAALSQWQGAILMLAAVCMGYLVRRFGRRGNPVPTSTPFP